MTKIATPVLRHCALSAAAVVALGLGGCAVGPDFVRPPPPAASGYTSSPVSVVLGAGTGETAQRLAIGKTVSADWWNLFHSHELDQVVRQALATNQTLAAARSTLLEAQQAIIEARGGFFPQLDLSAGAQRQRVSTPQSAGGGVVTGPASSTYSLYSLGSAVSYAPDVFGGTRRRLEQAKALARNQQYQLAAAYLTLTGNTVTQAINIASLRLQLQATRRIITDDETNLRLVERKFRAGKAARTDVITAQSQLDNDLAQLPPLRLQLSSARHALSILSGRFPVDWSPPAFDLSDFTLPPDLPLTLPSQLVRHRPDILAAEAQLHANSAAIGIATAQMYPNITLSAAFGLQSLSSSMLFEPSSETSSVAAALTAPLFHGGALKAQKQAAIYAYDAALATYRQTVLQAFGQVADVLRALGYDAQLVAAENRALETAQLSLRLQRLSYAAGKSDVLQLIDSERSYQQARLGYTRALTQRYQDTAQLLVALGGGFS